MSTETMSATESFPINLNAEEANDPLLVITDFFSADNVEGHLKELLEWRNCVLEERYYIDQKNNPSGLLFTHQINIKLIEAAYLLMQDELILTMLACNVQNEIQLIAEKQNWTYYPIHLAEKEISNPLIAINCLFNDYVLSKYRSLLYEWLENALSSSSVFEGLEATDIIRIYENLQKLYDIAWLIHQRTSNNPESKINDLLSEPEQIAKAESDQLYALNKVIETDQQEQLKQLVSIIKHKVPSVLSVTYLGRSPEPGGIIFLFVIVPDDEKRLIQELSGMIDDSCKYHGKVMALVHLASQFVNAVTDNSTFFSSVLTCPVIYLSGAFIMPKKSDLNQVNHDQKVLEKWQVRFNRSKEFLKGAEFYLDNEIHGLTMFCLHQSVESVLRSLIRAIIGYRVNIHNLDRLMRLSQMFTSKLALPFELDTAEGQKLFYILQHAYVDARYKDSFEIDGASVKKLLKQTGYLLEVADTLFKQHLQAVES